MAKGSHTDAASADRLRQAGAWRAQLALEGASTSPAFEAWLKADPRNPEAWEASRASWDIFESGGADPQVVAALEAAAADARVARTRRPWPARHAVRWAAVLAVMLAVALALRFYAPAQTFETDATRRDVVLVDGSKVSLDAGTRLKVRIRGDRRDLELVRGQAAFDVAHDPRRPFAVSAGDHRVVAVGTRFNIDLVGRAARITLVEGLVRVEPLAKRQEADAARAAMVNLRPGQQLIAEPAKAPTAPPQVTSVDPSKALAWQAGQLVVEDEALADVVARVSRYSDIKVEVNDPALAHRRISGLFIAGDIETFLDAVREHLSLDAVEVAPGRVELRRRAA